MYVSVTGVFKEQVGLSRRKPDYRGGCQRICKSSEVRLRARSTKEMRRLMESTLDYKWKVWICGWKAETHKRESRRGREQRPKEWFFPNIFFHPEFSIWFL